MTPEEIMFRSTAEEAVITFGRAGQLTKAIEEMAELQKELCKAITEGADIPVIDNISQEMADVEIMLEQLKIIFNNRERVDSWKRFKIIRLSYRINRERWKREKG